MTTDPSFLWMGEKHKEALAILKYAILENKGVLALTGDVGTGKTTLINALLKSLGQDTVSATIYDPRLEVLDFFNTVAAAFNIKETFEVKGRFILRFMEFLAKAHQQHQKVLLIIDEAQGISEELLEEIRLLSNLEAEYTKLLNIFFVGQTEFIDIIQKYENRALRQRISIRYHIDPLTLGETADYIRHRLEVSGAQAPIFDSGAIDEIFIFSGGYPRLINIMCDHALLTGYVQEVRVIGAGLIRECWKELVLSKKTDESNLKYPGETLRPLPKAPIPEKPPDIPIIPKEDSKPRKDIPIKSSPRPKITRPVHARRPVKKRFYQSPVVIAILLIVGMVAGYLFYGNAKDDVTFPVDSARKQIEQHFKMKQEPTNGPRPTVPFGSETSDISGSAENGKTESSRFFDDKPPNSSGVEGILPKGDGSFQSIPPERFAEETGKPDPVPEKPKSSELAKESSPAPVETPEPAAPVTTSVQALKATPEKYPAESELQKKKEPEIPKTISTEKRSPLVSTSPSKKPVAAPDPVPSKRRPEQPVVSKADAPKMVESAAGKTAQPAAPVPKEKKLAGRADERVVSSIGTPGKPAFKNSVPLKSRDLQTRLKAFLTDYSLTYSKKDLDKLSTYFAFNAVEKGKPFRSKLPQYRQNFERIDEMEYAIGLDRYAVQEDAGLIKIEGTFQVTARFAGSRELRKSTGQISMVLESAGDSFKIIQMDY